jgi:hypothetical protein
MYYDVIAWDDADDPRGNVQHILGPGEVTLEEVEEVIADHQGPIETSRSSGNSIIIGWTSTGKHIAVVFSLEDTPDLVAITPVTAYPVPEYGD